MRIYVHGGDPPLTVIVRLEDAAATLADAAAAFAAAARRRGRDVPEPAAFEAAGGARLEAGSRAADVLKDRDDLFLLVGADAGAPAAAPPVAPVPAPQPAAASNPPAAPHQAGTWGGLPAAPPAAVSSLLARAEAAAAGGRPRVAAQALRGALLQSPGHPEASARLAQLLLSAGRPADALPHARAAARASASAAAAPAAAGAPGGAEARAEARQLLGDCLLAAGDAAGALDAFREALQEAPTAQDGPPSGFELDLRMRCARALHAAGGPANAAAAGRLTMAALAASDQTHADALLLFAELALERGQADDAARVALRLLPQAPAEARVRAALGAAIETPDGLRAALEDIGAGPESSEALAFVAAAARDAGAVAAAAELAARAAAAAPGRAALALLLAHARELLPDPGGAVAAVLDWCSSAMAAQSGEPGDGGGEAAAAAAALPLKDAAALLSSLPPLPKGRAASLDWLLTGMPAAAVPVAGHQPDKQQDPQQTGQQPHTCKQQEEEDQQQQQERQQEEQQEEDDQQEKQPPPRRVRYSDAQLDALALLFTAAKVLFASGALPAAAALCAALEAPRAASEAELHNTAIRNEAAYFGCVAQLLARHPPPALHSAGAGKAASSGACAGTGTADAGAGVAGERPLYVLGDSHCLPVAWRHVTLRGERRLLRPLLVTGVKAWHLRRGGSFYPARQFWATAAALPRGAEVVLVVGEIDAREGLLQALEGLKYDSLEAAIDAVAAAYASALERLCRGFGLRVFAHPAPPALPEAASLVCALNAALRARASEAATAGLAVRWLDFEAGLLEAHPAASKEARQGGGGSEPDGSSGGAGPQLRREFCLDGTHLSPAYLPLLEEALNAAAASGFDSL
ncbi:hypothetical protein Rsub_12790 [Raphidocelis subcapitata]|uniref:Uncharacterized protein n=1 Tax=Raphidocelis subcapitata TaxID=307507 RepID=A0A2V0PJN0_9CHLO|nr:hypothetical protein Rsub_12790 [Raphidocelis subcapitata]|eukprot:GBG00012.1 hypothetical protein Rsub_12790 [Raphidocelis subcapitata]